MPIIQMASIGTQITEAFAGLDRIREILDTPREDMDPLRVNVLNDIRGEVAFNDVSFEYNKDVEVLKHVSFTAPAGSTTALVGASGGGKSTLIGLVMAFSHPKSGRVLVDGRDVTSLRLRDYRSHLGVVMQDNFLFDGTVRENIAFSKPGATDDEVRAAARIAHCDEFVSGFKDGYDTIVGERGVKLSGGQRQRVAIARAFLADAPILILDEATSALDSESEVLIQQAMVRLMEGRTSIVIAHRLSTVRALDRILVFDKGRMVEEGDHLSLYRKAGLYRRLCDHQGLDLAGPARSGMAAE